METTRTVTELFERFRTLTVEVLDLPEEQVVPEAHFADDLGADSLDLVELVEAMEAEFRVRIDDAELGEVATVGEAYDLLAGKVAA
jgi:acyl carrier protein